MKKTLLTVLSVVIAVAVIATMLTVFAGCDNKQDNSTPVELKSLNLNGTKTDLSLVGAADFGTPVDKANLKVGLICLHDKNSTYDKNFIDAMEDVQAELGLTSDQVVIVTGIPEGEACYTQACTLAEAGCNLIIADSFGHEEYLIKAAKEYPNVRFCHATGTNAHTENLPNFHNAFASIYEGRYLAGVAAGLKLKQMIDTGATIKGKVVTAENAKVGYVGAYTYAEVMSGYTSWFLGVRSIVPTATMEVTFTGSWYDMPAENAAALTLINRGCVLISQHADSMGAPNACEANGVPNVSYNGSTEDACPTTFIVSSRINWAPYYKYAINCVLAGKAIATDWVGTLATGSVELTKLGDQAAPAGTQAALETVKAQLEAGTLKVFDTNKFTVKGSKLTECAADVDSDENFEHETNAIVNGFFLESVGRSAPYFDVEIDGITLLDTAY